MCFTIYFTALVCIFGIAYAIPGGFSAAAKDDDIVKELAEFAVNELGPAFEITEIIGAKKQVK